MFALEELTESATSTDGNTAHSDPLVARFFGVLEAEYATSIDLPEEAWLTPPRRPR